MVKINKLNEDLMFFEGGKTTVAKKQTATTLGNSQKELSNDK